jgi:hypothetical protein
MSWHHKEALGYFLFRGGAGTALRLLTKDEAQRIGRELRQAAGAAARAAADKRGVTRLHPHIHDSQRNVRLAPNCGSIAAMRPRLSARIPGWRVLLR